MQNARARQVASRRLIGRLHGLPGSLSRHTIEHSLGPVMIARQEQSFGGALGPRRTAVCAGLH